MNDVVPVVPQRHHLQAMCNYLPTEQRVELDRYDGSTIEDLVEGYDGDQLWALEHKSGLTLGLSGMGAYRGISGLFGCSWVLTTCHMPTHAKSFLRTAKLLNEHYAESHPLLVGAIDATYEPGLKLMRFLGYTHGTRVTSPNGHPFVQFIYRRT